MRAPQGEWWITLTPSCIIFLSDFQILQAQTQTLELNSVYSGDTVNIYFLCVKKLA